MSERFDPWGPAKAGFDPWAKIKSPANVKEQSKVFDPWGPAPKDFDPFARQNNNTPAGDISQGYAEAANDDWCPDV